MRCCAAGCFAHHVQAFGNQRVVDLAQALQQSLDLLLGITVPDRLGNGEVQRHRLGLDQPGQFRALHLGGRVGTPPAIDGSLQIEQILVQAACVTGGVR